MLRKTIKYTDFFGAEREEEFYFNLTKAELLEMELMEDGGFGEMLQRVYDSQKAGQVFSVFKRFILSSYGERSDDGKRFVKNDAIREAFEQSAAYDVLINELATNVDSAAEFVNGIVPADLAEAAKAHGMPTGPKVPQDHKPKDLPVSAE